MERRKKIVLKNNKHAVRKIYFAEWKIERHDFYLAHKNIQMKKY